MISYTLKCSHDHRFDSWFQSAEAYEKLKSAGMVACVVCGNTSVEKAMMAPRVRPARSAASPAPKETETEQAPAPKQERPLSTPASPAEQAMSELRRKIEETSENVGDNFASEARAMHDGDAPERSIYGQARPEEAKALIDDGVPVTPLPFTIGRKTN